MGGYVTRKIVAPLREFMVYPRFVIRGHGGVRLLFFPPDGWGKENLVRGSLPRVRQPASCSITTPWQDPHSPYMHSTHPLLCPATLLALTAPWRRKGYMRLLLLLQLKGECPRIFTQCTWYALPAF